MSFISTWRHCSLVLWTSMFRIRNYYYKERSDWFFFLLQLRTNRSRGGSVGIVIMLRVIDRGSILGRYGDFLLFATASRLTLWPTQPPIQWVPRLKLPELKAYHKSPSSTKVKNAWSYTSTPQYVFMAWCLVKHRDNFTFHLYLLPPPPATSRLLDSNVLLIALLWNVKH
jgi:hypothetical protein